MSTEREQPAVGGVCLNCGAAETALDMELCERCSDMVVEERAARARALKENGRLRTERLAREAAAKPGQASATEGTAFDSSALLGGALRWIAEPTRAGWWVWWDFHQAAPELYLIKIEDTPLTKGAFYYHPGRQRWESCGFKNWRAMGVRGGWAGPVERPKASDEAAPPND